MGLPGTYSGGAVHEPSALRIAGGIVKSVRSTYVSSAMQSSPDSAYSRLIRMCGLQPENRNVFIGDVRLRNAPSRPLKSSLPSKLMCWMLIATKLKFGGSFGSSVNLY